MTAQTIFVGDIRAYFNTIRMLKATELSYLVMLLNMVEVIRHNVASNHLQTRCDDRKQILVQIIVNWQIYDLI